MGMRKALCLQDTLHQLATSRAFQEHCHYQYRTCMTHIWMLNEPAPRQQDSDQISFIQLALPSGTDSTIAVACQVHSSSSVIRQGQHLLALLLALLLGCIAPPGLLCRYEGLLLL